MRRPPSKSRSDRVDNSDVTGVTLNSNFAERIGTRALATSQARIGRSLERLSTGKQLNRASDDPAGLISSEALKGQQKSVLAQIQLNVREGHRYAAIDGALSGVGDLLQSLKTNVLQAANTGGLSAAEREALQIDTNGIIDALSHLSNFEFDGSRVLEAYIGASANVSGPSGTANVSVSLNSFRSGGTFNVVSGDLEKADGFVDSLISSIAGNRAAAGLEQRRLDRENTALATQNENLSAAISQIVDTDYAVEVGELVRSQVLAEAAKYAILTARNLQAETVLALIKGQATKSRERFESGKA